ncbi:hypothetical protein BDV18DRAFT_142245 [Aspergillus unguis]
MPRQIAPGRSCLECRRRKIKCDRGHPCSYCVKVRINCKYPASRHNEDRDRVAALESELQNVQKLLAEIDPSKRVERTEERENIRLPSATRSSMLLRPQAPIDINQVKPSAPTIAILWEKYLDVVDPVLKMVHTPTVQKLVVEAMRDRELDLASQCLLFAVYYGAVAAMSQSDCKDEFQENRRVLLDRYRRGVEHLLSRLDLVNCTDLSVLQAFTIYLITGRCDHDGPDVFGLVGLAIGLALKAGLNQDGETLGLPPFAVEMRRRLWWQLLTLDIRVAEDRRSEPCILEASFNTRFPSNISDTDLHPQMSRLPLCGGSRTEMLFSLIRFEVSYFARQMVFSEEFGHANAYMSLTTQEKCHALDLFQERIKKQYLCYCDENVPLDVVTSRSTRLIFAKLRLAIEDTDHISAGQKAAHRRGWIRILTDAEDLRRYKDGKQLLWLFQTYTEWDALYTLLLHLRDDPGAKSQEWETAKRVYSYWKGHKGNQHDRRWERIELLRTQLAG